MQLIKPSYSIIEQPAGLEGVYKMIEIAGRTCYKSEDKITEDSAKGFVDRMIKSGHGAMLEHGTVYLFIKVSAYDQTLIYHIQEYKENPYSKVIYLGVDDNETNFKDILGNSATGCMQYVVTTNYRVLVENGWLDDLKYLCEPTEFHEKRVTVRFICPISISREFNRHRVNSIAEQSTRYCNYSKDKFNNEISFIEPYWYKGVDSYTKSEFERGLQYAEGYYMFMIDKGMKPQEAREILPLCTATELVHTAFVKDWEHFFFLRDAAAAHPQAKELAELLHKEFIERGYIK